MTIAEHLLVLILSVVLNQGIALWLTRWREKKDAAGRINADISKLIDISLQYPFLQNCDFLSKYEEQECIPDKSNQEEVDRFDRYQFFCCFVSNLMEDLYAHCEGDEEKMYGFVHYQEIMFTHRFWWSISSAEEPAYNAQKGFGEFVVRQIKEADEREQRRCA